MMIPTTIISQPNSWTVFPDCQPRKKSKNPCRMVWPPMLRLDSGDIGASTLELVLEELCVGTFSVSGFNFPSAFFIPKNGDQGMMAHDKARLIGNRSAGSNIIVGTITKEITSTNVSPRAWHQPTSLQPTSH